MAHENHLFSREESLEYYTNERLKRQRKVRLGVIICSVIGVLCVAAVCVGVYVFNLNNAIATNDKKLESTLKSTKHDEPFYMLLLGADKGEERIETEGADDSNYRADSIMLCRIDPVNVKATLVSIHRDLLVIKPDGTRDKINSIFPTSGAAGMVTAVNNLADVEISHYAQIDFDTFMKIIDTLGGVEVTLPVAVVDPEYTELNLPAGTQTLNSHDALMLCRARHAYDQYGDGDLYRAANQRAVITSIVRKLLASDAATMTSAITEVAKSIKTDLSLDEILTIANQMSSLNTETDLYSGMTPTEPVVMDDVYYEILKIEEWATMMDRVDAGLPPYESDDQDETLGVASSAYEGAADTDAATSSSSNASTDSSTSTSTSSDSATDSTASTNADKSSTEATSSTSDADKSATDDANKGDALANVDKTGAVAVTGYLDNTSTALAEDLTSKGFNATAYEDTSFTFDKNLVVYGDAALAEEAEALAAYLGDDYTAILNDGSFYLISDIVVRVAQK